MPTDLLTPHEVAQRLGVSLDDLPRVAGLLGICLDLRTGKRSPKGINLTFTRVRSADLQALIDGMGQGARP